MRQDSERRKVEFPCSQQMQRTIERRAAFYRRSWNEKLNYTLAVLYEEREPDPEDTDMIRRVAYLRKRGELPRQQLSRAKSRLASIDQVSDRAVIPTPTTVSEVLQIYLEHKLKGRRSYARACKIVKVTITNHVLGDWTIASLTPKIIRQWHAGMVNRHVTANNALKLLRTAFRFCQRLDLVPDDPTNGVQRFREESRDRYVTPAEMPRLLYALGTAPVRPQAYFLIVLFTASRPGEVSVMKWADLDFVGRRWRKPTSKTGKPQEVVLIPIVYRLLQQLPKISEYVFPGQDLSQPWGESTVRKAWAQIRRVAKLPDVIAYDLRRTMASWMANQGVNLSTIQAVLNHATLQATHRYARLDVQTAGRALEGITRHMVGSSSVLAGLCAPLSPEEATQDGERVPEPAVSPGMALDDNQQATSPCIEMEWPG